MSTERGSQPSNPGRKNELDQLAGNPVSKPAQNYPDSSALVDVEQELAREKDGSREDRFLFVVALVIIFDVWAMQGVDTWTLPLVVGVTQLFALLIFARRMGVEEIHFWLNQLLPRINLGLKKPEPQPPAEKKPEAPKTEQGTEGKVETPKPDQKQ